MFDFLIPVLLGKQSLVGPVEQPLQVNTADNNEINETTENTDESKKAAKYGRIKVIPFFRPVDVHFPLAPIPTNRLQ